MDVSKEYIKMCDCEEIQSIKPDCYLEGRISGIPYLVYYGGFCNYWNNLNLDVDDDNFIWLPRQDQLQDMMEKHYEDRTTKLYLHYEFHNFLESKYLNISAQNAFILLMNMFEDCSFEQLWLAFVMKEKHNKTWDGDKWI